ncbi:uncharacterized protein LOC129293067 [Prosopis cineraria]|uniref:uncharacterized protein LOC129293067 n=1 Tax=Prosopis cineraria TaxID=364024 RepID=UPI0024107C9D|nr:uncharacterized protein LOC129293067 [Prosopis cineraria]
MAEQNNELLMKNHESRLTGSTPFLEVNAVTNESAWGYGRGRGHSHGRGRGRGHGSTSFDKKWTNNEEKHKKGISRDNNNNTKNLCYRCGGKGHWPRTCRTPKHLIDLYQESLESKSKNKEAKIETHFASEEGDSDYGDMDVTHLDVADFFADLNGRIDHLIGDGNVQK